MSAFAGIWRGGALSVLAGTPRIVRSAGATVLLDGFVADLGALRSELGLARPTNADADPDTGPAEAIAHAWRRWGAELPAKVHGEFAAAILDPAARTLLLLTDALGIEAIHYAAQRDGIVFSSSLETLVGHCGVGELDEGYLVRTLCGVDPGPGATPYRAVRKLLQTRALLARPERFELVTAYRPQPAEKPAAVDADRHAEALRAAMIEAVRLFYPERARTWCELSGGLDSSSIVSIARRVLGRDVETFSTVFSRTPQADESGPIADVLAEVPCPSFVVDADCHPPFRGIPSAFQGEPTGTALIVGFNAARSAMLDAHGIGTVLTGMCGDAVLLGDGPEPYFLADIANPVRLARAVDDWTARSPLRRPAGFWLREYVLKPRTARLAPLPVPLPPWLDRAFAAHAGPVVRDVARLPGLGHGDSFYWRRVLRGAGIVRDGQRWPGGSTAFRNPLLHLPLVECIAAIDWTVKLRPEEERSLHRRALAGILPEATRRRRDKKVPSRALAAGLRDSDEWCALLGERPAIVERGYVSGSAWREAVERARFGVWTAPAAFLHACMVEAWFHTLPLAPRGAAAAPVPEPTAAG